MKPVEDFIHDLTLRVAGIACLVGDGPREDEFIQKYTRWMLSGRQALSFAGLESYLAEFNTIANVGAHPGWNLPRLAGILESALECVKGGLVGKLIHLVHAEFFDSLTAQANELLRCGHSTPAAVLARIVIEQWLRDQAEKAGIPDWKIEKASKLNDSLRIAGVYALPKSRNIQGLLDVGNYAAHGKPADFTDHDVQRMIDFAETNCT